MKFHRPRSLNGLILVGFGLVGLPLLVAVVWALFNLDRLAEQSERLVFTGVATADNNRLLTEQLGSLERVVRQYEVLRNTDSLQLLRQDLETLVARLSEMGSLTDLAGATPLSLSIGAAATRIVVTMEKANLSVDAAQAAIAEFIPLRQSVTELTAILTAYVDSELRNLQESTRHAQRVSAW